MVTKQLEVTVDNESLKIYKLIGKIHQVIAATDTLDDALKEGLQTILSECDADYAVIWYGNDKDDLLHPYYWIAPVDFTNKTYKRGEGIVGKTFSEQKTTRRLDYAQDRDETVDEMFEDIEIASYLCVPFSSAIKDLGCIEFVKKVGSGKFDEKEADTCDILTMMASMAVEENDKIELDWKSKEVVISARNIHKEFKNGDVITKVLKGVNLDVYEGEFLVLLGESGCGKSTLLNIVSGMDSCDEGEIIFEEKDLANANEEELTDFRRKNIGFIFQSYNLMPNLTAVENLDLIGELVENPMDSTKALELVGLKEKKNNFPNQMSGGQQQRVSIARALVKNPKLIIADEPTAALDYTTSIEVLSVMEKIVESGATLVMVTHNEEITRMADRVVRMRNGQVYEVTVNKKRAKAIELEW